MTEITDNAVDLSEFDIEMAITLAAMEDQSNVEAKIKSGEKGLEEVSKALSIIIEHPNIRLAKLIIPTSEAVELRKLIEGYDQNKA